MTIKNKTILNAGTIPHVALDFMNKTHFEEIELVEKLGEAITEYQQSDEITADEIRSLSNLLDAWLVHTKAHFDRENELMLDIQFPMVSVHSGEHDRVLEEMDSIIKSWLSNHDIDALADYVFSSWPEWFDNHVNSMDMITAHFAVMNGYDSDSTPDKQD